MSSTTLLLGDCAEQMRTLADNSIDSIVTDPPYGLAFMGADFDTFHAEGKSDNLAFQESMTPIFAEALRVAKPGAHLLAFGGTRTYHRLACAIEDAGWEIRDCCFWCYGCLDEETQILTQNGWKGIGEINVGDAIIGYNTTARKFLVEPCEHTYLYDYDDTAYRIQSDCTDQLVSRNHRVIVERGGVEIFEYAENLAQEQEARVPVLESMQNLLDHIPMLDKRAGASEQNMLAGMCCGVGAEDAKETLGRPFTKHDLSCVREEVFSSSCMEAQDKNELLLKEVQWEIKKRKVAGVQQKKEGKLLGGSGRICQMSGMEESQMPEGIPCYGRQIRKCCGASVSSSKVNRASIDINRGRSPCESQQTGQQSRKPDVVQVKCRPHTLRVSWHTVSTLARITPIHYKGRMWCVSVPSGAIVARRNGKVFVTGNSGFPKSMDVSKAIDKMLGAERTEVIGHENTPDMRGGNLMASQGKARLTRDITAPATPEAAAWNGYGTCLKPAVEPIVVARKPLEGTVAANVLKYGTGAINIDACRVPTENAPKPCIGNGYRSINDKNAEQGYRPNSYSAEKSEYVPSALGRFPANLIHDGSDEVLALFPDSKGQCGAVKGNEPSELTRGIYGKFSGDRPPCSPRNDSGSAARFFNSFRDGEASADRRYTAEGSTNFAMKPGMRRPPEDTPARFFYCAKASRSERNKNCERLLQWEQNQELTQLIEKSNQLLTGISESGMRQLKNAVCNMTSYGSGITDQSQEECKSTISTALKLITELKTSLSSQPSNTSDAILDAIKTSEESGINVAQLAEKLNLLKLDSTNGQTDIAINAVNALFDVLSEIRGRAKQGNHHVTIKPLALMRWLITLVTPPGGTVLDPFMGSGTTGVAARQLDRPFVGIERDPHYYEIASRRIAEAKPLPPTTTQQELPL